jgi:zinc transport system permease protein
MTRQLWQTILVATGLNMLFMVGGLALSYRPDLPAGATIILLTGVVYLLVVSVGPLIRRLRSRKPAAGRS